MLGSSCTVRACLATTVALLGCLCAPVVDNTIERFGFAVTSYAVAAMGAAYSLLMLSPSIDLQVATALIFLVVRCLVRCFFIFSTKR